MFFNQTFKSMVSRAVKSLGNNAQLPEKSDLTEAQITHLLNGRSRFALHAHYQGVHRIPYLQSWTLGYLLIFNDGSAELRKKPEHLNQTPADILKGHHHKWRSGNNDRSTPLVFDTSTVDSKEVSKYLPDLTREFVPDDQLIAFLRKDINRQERNRAEELHWNGHDLKPPRKLVVDDSKLLPSTHVETLLVFENFTTDWGDDGGQNRWVSGASHKQDEIFIVVVSRSDFQTLQKFSNIRNGWR